ncbi:hypothetical protein GvMRE_IIg249 [endosymbiont GvMRE of Glomus versiforme]|nr:hypothetical protein GvMRE_IIg249 [endosymbiont GvMRE of Glomus versiforme]
MLCNQCFQEIPKTRDLYCKQHYRYWRIQNENTSKSKTKQKIRKWSRNVTKILIVIGFLLTGYWILGWVSKSSDILANKRKMTQSNFRKLEGSRKKTNHHSWIFTN